MRKQRLRKSMRAAWIGAAMALAGSSLAFGAAQALPNGTIVNVGDATYLTDPLGERYSGWFLNTDENWYYFNESDKTMKTGWHHDEKDGYWYYLNPSDGRMVAGWQKIDGKEYFFQPVRNMGNYYFSSQQEKWLYSLNSTVPYGAMYTSTVTPDGSQVDGNGERITNAANAAAGTSSSKTDYKGSYQLKGNEWIDIKTYYWKDNALYLQGTYCDGIPNPNPEYEADRIHFVTIKENVTVMIDSNTNLGSSAEDLTKLKEWLDSAMAAYGNAELGIRLDGDYVVEIIDFMVMP